MLKLKYYNGIEQAQRRPTPRGPGDLPPPYIVKPDGPLKHALGRVQGMAIRATLALFRAVCPNPRFCRLVIVTRADDVREVLNNPDAFEVPFALEMTELGGVNSVLGMEGCPHARLRGQIHDLLLGEADEAWVRTVTAQTAQALIANSGGRLDVVGDLITRCATESCAAYFGFELEDPSTFADWTMAISEMLFADPLGGKQIRQRGLYASHRVQEVINRAIATAHLHIEGGEPPRTLTERFVARQQHEPDLTDAKICATLIGLMTGFIPTNTLAAGKMLEALRKRPKAWEAARTAAIAQDRTGLCRMLMEAGRLNPALFPGQWRYARGDSIIAQGTFRQRRVRKGSVLLVGTGSALADSRAYPSPGSFRPGRGQDPELMFGHGPHACLGAALAKVQITEMFLILLNQQALAPVRGAAGRMQWAGPFPRRLDMEFTPPQGATPQGQSMVAVCAPLEDHVDEVRRGVADLGERARAQLVATGRIHFASLSVVELGEPERPAPHLLLEINADGTPDDALQAVAAAGSGWLAPLFGRVVGGDAADLLGLLRRYNIAAHAKPWSMTHLNFNGTPEFSVADIQRQDDLAAFAQRAIDHFLRPHLALGRRSILPLRHVRRLIQGHPDLQLHASRDSVLSRLLEEGAQFRDFLIQPAGKRLKIADWVEISLKQARWRIVFSKDALPAWLTLAAGWLILSAGLFLAFGGTGWRIAAQLLAASVTGLVAELILVALGAVVAFRILRLKEARDIPDTRHVDLDHLRACTANEDIPGYAQNHFIATPTLKPGLFRRLTLALALWGIGTLVTHGFRPGFVLNMGTIHYAKWFRAPGTRRLVFLSNYDGSWDSYLEDFITKAHLGQTAAWSNCEGFPPTQGLIEGGAQDGDRFKRWVRRQQTPSGFWFSRFPHLTTERIRNNALIHYGLTHAHTDSAARAWLACFGSQQRPESMLETDDVQSLVFSGFPLHKHALCAVLRLPDSPERLREWLNNLIGEFDLAAAVAPSPELAVTFGDAPGGLDRRAAVAFTATGLRKLGLPDGAGEEGDGLATFPGTFRMGMSGRSRVLGDAQDDLSDLWRWRDVAIGEQSGSDAALMIYATRPEDCEGILQQHLDILGGAALVHRVATQPAAQDSLRQEHFGFQDGISQPVIRGTQRFVSGEALEDVLEPGEFILGYRSNQGYFPASPVVRSDSDYRRRLATAQAESPKRFPAFADDPLGSAFHDFGRNGSFLVLRQFEQHVDRFQRFTNKAAARLQEGYPDLEEAIGRPPAPDWVAAKMVGRWQDGSPLIDRPHYPRDGRGRGPARDKNDFAFGVDDPQGLRCPLGAHIRRANPRDSFDPSDPRGREITNRHRLLRRGRAYALESADGQEEKGLLFGALCTDLERQFEFILQTWINAPAFHGLNREADPLLRGDLSGAFTIPTPVGAIQLEGLERFVTVRGGGYYFLPSRSALAYLADRCTAAANTAKRAAGRHSGGAQGLMDAKSQQA